MWAVRLGHDVVPEGGDVTARTLTPCNAPSPICKGDEGPVRCDKPKGHDGEHCAQRGAWPETKLYERTWSETGGR